jgi:hypothetical protein
MSARDEAKKLAPAELLNGVYIPPPLKCANGEGMTSLSLQANGVFVSFRIHKSDRQLMKEEAAAIGLTPSALMRWASVHLAQELHLRRTGKLKQVRP